MAAASLATSVPRIPIATPTFAFFSAARIVDAVAEHGDDLAAGLKRLHDDELVLRRHPAERARTADRLIPFGTGQRIELAAVQAVISGTEDAELTPHRFGREPLIAGQHQRAEARGAQPRDRLLDASGRRIGESEEAKERQPVQRVLGRRAHVARAHRQHAQAARRELVVHRYERGTPLRVERRSPSGASARALISRMRRGAPFASAVSTPSR